MADEYISRKSAYKFMFDIPNPDGAGEIEVVSIDDLDAIPTADVRPVVRGKWIDEPIYKQTLDGKTYDGYTYCSNCKADYPFGHKAYFCEVCGADMREVKHDNPGV